MPWSNAFFKIGRASASSMHQGSHLVSPKDMAPRMGFETRRPEEPSWTYLTFEGVGVMIVDLCFVDCGTEYRRCVKAGLGWWRMNGWKASWWANSEHYIVKTGRARSLRNPNGTRTEHPITDR